MDSIFFDNWNSVIRTLILTPLGYIAMIMMLRVSGKRTLAKMNAFDFIGTVALGSALATVALNKNVTLTDGVIAIALLILVQFCLTWLSVRYSGVKDLITSRPSLLLYKGEMQKKVMKKERLTEKEIFAAAREQGISNIKNIDAIVLETTGAITIIKNLDSGNPQTLNDVVKQPEKL